jgi:inorganic triphosphatase YgiF
VAPDEPSETELKLLVRPQDRPALERHPLLQAESGREERDEHTTYFDTPQLALANRGLSLRVRRSGDKRVQTLKSAGGERAVAGSRGEWEWPLDGDVPDLARVAEVPSAADIVAAAAAELEPVFRTDIRRTVRHLDLPCGAMVEAAFDEGEVSSGAARQDVSELELELKHGSPGCLYRLALELHSLAPFTIGAESKAERGRRLRTGEAPRSVKGKPPELEEDEPAEATVRRIITAELGSLVANQPAAAAGDVEGVHQMRVGIRRLRTVLVLFGKYLDRETTGRWEAELKRLGQVFGSARDWDVFCTETLPAVAEDAGSREWANTLRTPAEAERRAAHATVEAELGRPALTGLILDMAAWSEPDGEGGASHSDDRRLQRSIAKLVPGLLDRMARKVEKRGGRLRRRPAGELHRLRKALKKLRYSVDYVSAFYSDKQTRRYQKAAKRLLKLLGAGNDARVAASLAESLCPHNGAELGRAAAGVAKWSAERAAQTRRELPKAWSTFASASPPWP